MGKLFWGSTIVQFSGQNRFLKISFSFLISIIRAGRGIGIGGRDGKSNVKKKTTRIKSEDLLWKENSIQLVRCCQDRESWALAYDLCIFTASKLSEEIFFLSEAHVCAHAGIGTYTDLSHSCSCKHTYPLWLPSAAHSCERFKYTPFRLSPALASVAPSRFDALFVSFRQVISLLVPGLC